MIKKRGFNFELKNGMEVIQTSPHSVRFSDGTEFIPTSAGIDIIKDKWVILLNVKREFTVVPGFIVPTTKSTQRLSDEGVDALRSFKNDGCLVLVSFMILAALKEMGIRDEFPYVVGINATKETSRSAPQDKICDVNNFAY